MLCKTNCHTPWQHASAADCDCCERHGGADAFFLIDQAQLHPTRVQEHGKCNGRSGEANRIKKIDCCSDGPLMQISYTQNKRMSSQVSRDVCNLEPMRCKYYK